MGFSNKISISCGRECLTSIGYFSFYAKVPVKHGLLKIKLKTQDVVIPFQNFLTFQI
jgi:hypothetical protein